MTGSALLIFVVGTLAGVLAGGVACLRLFRQQVAGEFGPRLRRMQLQLESLETAINLALLTRYDEISRRPPPHPPLPPPDGGGQQS
jgi:hypothetical protein